MAGSAANPKDAQDVVGAPGPESAPIEFDLVSVRDHAEAARPDDLSGGIAAYPSGGVQLIPQSRDRLESDPAVLRQIVQSDRAPAGQKELKRGPLHQSLGIAGGFENFHCRPLPQRQQTMAADTANTGIATTEQ